MIDAGVICVPGRDLSLFEHIWETEITVLAQVGEEIQHQETVRMARKQRSDPACFLIDCPIVHTYVHLLSHSSRLS